MKQNSAVVRDICGLAARLEGLGDLSPRAEVNEAFVALVQHAMAKHPVRETQKILGELGDAAVLPRLRQLCAQGEFAMEKHWGERIRQAVQPMEEMMLFPYWENYRKLAKLEVAALREAVPGLRKVLFVGAGPLPLTAYMYAQRHGLDVTNLDVDADAVCCAIEWMQPLLDMAKPVPCLHMDVREFKDFGDYDVVVLAALVGLEQQEKREIVNHLAAHMHARQVLMARSVRGMRQLLYPAVQEADLQGFRVERMIHPRGDVVNSVVIARKDVLG